MKRTVIVTAMAFFVFGLLASCATTATSKQKLVQGPDFVFKTKPGPHPKKYAYGVSISCIQKRWQKLEQGYNGNPYTEDPVIMDYFKTLNRSILGTPCSNEYEVLEGTYKGFKPEDLMSSSSVSVTTPPSQTQQNGFDTIWYQKRNSAITLKRQANVNVVTVRGNRARIAMLSKIIPAYWQETAQITPVLDSTLGDDVWVTGNGGKERITFRSVTVTRLNRMMENPRTGDSLLSICPGQSTQLGRALGRPALATYTASCPDGNCEHAKAKHLKNCTKPLDWSTTANGTPVAYVVCELKGGKVEGQISAAWRFDPYKPYVGSDGYYLGFVKYSRWEPVMADWGGIPQTAWAHIERISQQRPMPTEPPVLYDVCGYRDDFYSSK